MNAAGCADTADAKIAQSVHDATNGGKPAEILLKFCGIGANGMRARQRVRDPVLSEVVARGHLAAEAIAPRRNGHLPWDIRCSLHKHRHIEPCEPQRIRDGALVAEIRKRYDDAIDFVAMFLEQRGTPFGFFMRFDSAMLAIFRPEHDTLIAGLGDRPHHLFASSLGELIGEEAAIPHNDPECHFAGSHNHAPYEETNLFLAACGPARRIMHAIEQTRRQQQRTPPDTGVQLIQHHGELWRHRQLIETCQQNQHAVDQQRNADKEPDRNGRILVHAASPKDDL